MSNLKSIVSQQAYRDWSSQVGDLPVFQQSWWMDAVCGENGWTAALVLDNVEAVRAAMALPIGKKWGMNTRIQPLMTPFSGPYFSLPPSDNRTLIKEKTMYWEIMSELIGAFPVVTLEALHLNPGIDDWLPFHWNNFKQTTRYTFRLRMQNPEALFDQLKGNVRTHIRKAEQTLRVELSDDIDSVHRVHVASFDRKNNKTPIGLDYFRRVYSSCKERNAAMCWVVKNEEEKIIAGIICVHDDDTAYLLISGTDVRNGAQGAINLAYWEAIRYYSEKVKVFDFEGSMLSGVASLFLSFGAEMTPYHRVYRCNNWILEAGLRLAGKWG